MLMAPYDGGPWVRKSEYEEVAQKIISDFGLSGVNAFDKIDKEDQLFEIVCDSKSSLDAQAIKKAVDSFTLTCTPFVALRPIALSMEGQPELDGMFSNDASYKVRIAFNGTQKMDRWAGHHNDLATHARVFAQHGIEEIVFIPRRIGSKPQRLSTVPRFETV
jgi:hypothetical protein